MKYILLFFLLFSLTAKSQSVSYYASDGNKWQCITVISPPSFEKNAKAYYVNSESKIVESIKEIKEVRNDTISASFVTIGLSKQRYLLVGASGGKYLVLSDDKQRASTVFYPDSKMMFPAQSVSKPSSSAVSQLLIYGAKLLKYML